MQFGPDAVPVGNSNVIIGPPLRAPAPVPVTVTPTVITPLVYEPGPTLIDVDSNIIVDVPYAVAVSDEGQILTSKVTSINFVGSGVVATNDLNAVTVTIAMPSIAAGTGISVSTANNVTTITNTIAEVEIAAGTGISVSTANNISTVTNTFTEIVYAGGNVSGTVIPNRNNGTIQKFTLTGNITLNPPINMAAGQSLTLILTQDSVGNRLLDANVSYLFASGFQTLSNSSGSIDMMNIFSDGSAYYTTLTVDYS